MNLEEPLTDENECYVVGGDGGRVRGVHGQRSGGCDKGHTVLLGRYGPSQGRLRGNAGCERLLHRRYVGSLSACCRIAGRYTVRRLMPSEPNRTKSSPVWSH